MRYSLTILSGCLVVVMTGCGLFLPRDSDPPASQQTRVDPLSFSKLLSGTSISFTSLDYNELFYSSMTYQQLNRPSFDKTSVINRLREIESQYPAIAVRWTLTKIPPSFSTSDTNDLFGVTYAVYLDTTRPAARPNYTGTCDFKLWYSNAWTISGWSDQPDSVVNNLSFFSPL